MSFCLKRTIPVFCVFILCAYTNKKDIPAIKTKYTSKKSVKIPEPSDIVIDKENHELFIPSDNGILFKCDSSGTVVQQAVESGWDFEGVEIRGNSVYVSDESSRKVYKYNKQNLVLEAVYPVSCMGGRNEGFESITYNESKKCFVLVSEKNPVSIMEYDDSFQLINQRLFKNARDISSARWHNGYMYLLSDEDRCILQCDPLTYGVKQIFHINVNNPEGIAFDPSGKLVIAADDIQHVYYFINPLTAL